MKSPSIFTSTTVLAIVSAATLALPPVRAGTIFAGKWRAVAATSNGEAAPKTMLSGLTLVFTGDKVSITGAPPTRFKLNPKTKPARIDFLNSARQVGIYQFEGKTLKICVGQKGDRPRSFVTKKFSDHTYLRLERIK